MIRICSIFLTVVSFSATAAVSDYISSGARNVALGGASLLTDGGAYSVKDNPAAVAYFKRPSLAASMVQATYNLDSINRYSSTTPASKIVSDPYDATKASSLKAVNAALVLPLNERVNLGLMAFLPTDSLARIHAYTGNESNYLLFNDRQLSPEIYTAFSGRVTEYLAFGGGLYYSAKATGAVQIGLSNSDAESRAYFDIKPAIIPYGGIDFSPIGDHRLVAMGVAYKGENRAKSDINFSLNYRIDGAGNLPINVSSAIVAFYEPAILSYGTTLRLSEQSPLKVHLSANRTFWSKYKAPVIDLSGANLTTLIGGAPSQYQIKLVDTWSLKGGLEYLNILETKNTVTDLYFGGEYHESALPNSLQSVAVIDSNRFALSLGGGTLVKRIGTVITNPFKVVGGVKWISIEDKNLEVRNGGVLEESAHVGGSIYIVSAGVEFEI